LSKIHYIFNTGRNHVEPPFGEDLLSADDDRTADGPREPLCELAVPDLVVAGDGNRVEALAFRLEHETPRRKRAVAPHRAVVMKVSREHPISAQAERRRLRSPIADAAGDKADGDERSGCDLQARHH